MMRQKAILHWKRRATTKEEDACSDGGANIEQKETSRAMEPHQDEVDFANHERNHPGVDSPAEKWRRRRILLVYFLTSTLLYADLSLMAPNLSAIAEEFGFDDEQRDVKLGGMIALAFFLVGVPTALAIGWLADFVNRSPLYGITVFVGEAACFATYFTTTFAQLFAMRTLTGISIGGSLPVVFSVLGDLYPATQRNGVAAIITCGTGMGIGLGQALAGFLGRKHGWRFPFLVVSIPGMACSFLLACIKDPERGKKEAARIEFDDEIQRIQQDEAEPQKEEACPDEEQPDVQCPAVDAGEENPNENEQIPHFEVTSAAIVSNDEANRDVPAEKSVSWKTTWEMLKTPSVTLTLLQAAPSALPFGFASVFLNDYLAEDRGMTVEEATGVLIMFGAGNAIGVLVGGLLGHYGYKRDVRYPPAIMGSSLIFGVVPTYFLINWVDGDSNIGAVTIIGLLAGILVVIPVPLERAILTNVTVPESRGRANSFLSILDDLGKGLGPAIVSVLIQALERPTAFNLSLLGWVVGGIISFIVCCFVKHDEELTQERVLVLLRKQAMNDVATSELS